MFRERARARGLVKAHGPGWRLARWLWPSFHQCFPRGRARLGLGLQAHVVQLRRAHSAGEGPCHPGQTPLFHPSCRCRPARPRGLPPCPELAGFHSTLRLPPLHPATRQVGPGGSTAWAPSREGRSSLYSELEAWCRGVRGWWDASCLRPGAETESWGARRWLVPPPPRLYNGPLAAWPDSLLTTSVAQPESSYVRHSP